MRFAETAGKTNKFHFLGGRFLEWNFLFLFNVASVLWEISYYFLSTGIAWNHITVQNIPGIWETWKREFFIRHPSMVDPLLFYLFFFLWRISADWSAGMCSFLCIRYMEIKMTGQSLLGSIDSSASNSQGNTLFFLKVLRKILSL